MAQQQQQRNCLYQPDTVHQVQYDSSEMFQCQQLDFYDVAAADDGDADDLCYTHQKWQFAQLNNPKIQHFSGFLGVHATVAQLTD